MDLFLNNVRAALGPHGEGYESTIDAILALRAKVESAVEVQTVTLCDKHGMGYVKGCDDCAADLEMLTVMGPPEDVNPAPPTSGEWVSVVRGFEYVAGVHTPTATVTFDRDDWEARDRFAASLLAAASKPTPADESGADCIGDVCGLAKRTGVTCAEGECDKLAGVRTAEPRAAAQDGCGACGDGCAKRGACRLAEESPKAAAQEDDRPVAEVGHYINQGFTLAIVSVCWDRLKAGDKLYLQPSGAAEDAARCAWCGNASSANALSHKPGCRVRTHPHSDAARRARGESNG